MNKEETKKVLGIIIASYPTYKPEWEETMNAFCEVAQKVITDAATPEEKNKLNTIAKFLERQAASRL